MVILDNGERFVDRRAVLHDALNDGGKLGRDDLPVTRGLELDAFAIRNAPWESTFLVA
jgi:hypothetical protein